MPDELQPQEKPATLDDIHALLDDDQEVIERVREGGEVEIRRTTRRNRRIHDELPLVAEKYMEFRETGEVTL